MASTVRQALLRARKELADAEAAIEKLRIKVQGLEFAAEDDRPAQREAVPQASGGGISRTEAILRALRDEDGPRYTRDLVAKVRSIRGQNDKAGDISSTLSYLSSHGKVRRLATGEWLHPEVEDPYPDPGEERPGTINPDDIPF